MIRTTIAPPENAVFGFDVTRGPVAISPDGRALVFAARPAEGSSQLWIRGGQIGGYGDLRGAVLRDRSPVSGPEGGPRFLARMGAGRRAHLLRPGSQSLVSVAVRAGSTIEFGTPTEIENVPIPGLGSGSPTGYDILRDNRIVSVAPGFDDGPAGGVRVVTNWYEELKRLVPVN